MNSVNSISGSALQAFGTSGQVTANNVANLNTDGFKAADTTFRESAGGGVTVKAAVTQDTVDISREAVNLISDTQGFKANVNVLRSVDEMTKELFSIKA